MEIHAIAVELAKLQLGANDSLVVKCNPLSDEERQHIISCLKTELQIRNPILFVPYDLELSVLTSAEVIAKG